MKKYLYVLTLTYFLCIDSIKHHKNDQLLYLEKKILTVHNKIEGNTRKIREIIEENSIKSDILGSYKHPNRTIDVNVFTFKNRTYFLINNEIFLGILNKTFNLIQYCNFTDQKYTTFFKAIEYEDIGIIVQQVFNDTLVYHFDDNLSEPKLIQRIVSHFASDGLLFINQNKLYLIVSTHHGDYIASFTVYKWLDSHFDEVEVVYTNGVHSLESFSWKSREIIMILQTDMLRKSFWSVYEFQLDSIKKIQHINSKTKSRIDIIVQNQTPYVLIYEEFAKQLLYKWNGFEIVLVNTFEWKHRVDKSVVVYNNLTPIIVLPQLEEVLIYKPNNKAIDLENTKKYLTNYSTILNVHNDGNENGSITFIVGLTEDSVINIYAMSFKATPEIDSQQVDSLADCFHNLEQNIHEQNEKINQIKHSLALARKRKRDTIRNKTIQTSDIENKVQGVKNRLNRIIPFTINHEDTGNSVIINDNIVINTNLLAKRIHAHSIDVKTINEKLWTPKNLLKIKKKQTIRGPVIGSSIKTRTLIIDETKDTLFKNLLLRKGNQKLEATYTINRIVTNDIKTKKINDIYVENIYRKSQITPVKGQKSFLNIDVANSHVEFINNVSVDHLMTEFSPLKEQTVTFASNVSIRDLTVETIDGINWDNFKDSAYRIGQNKKINGSITIPALESKQITVRNINWINTDDLMTKTTDQVINSSIEFNYIKAFSIRCNTTNDIDITKAVRTNQNGSIISGPVQLDNADIKGNLQLIGNSSYHGYSQSDFIQIYDKNVIIKGNLIVRNLTIQPNTTIFINNNKYSFNDLHRYWTKNTNQIIPNHFEATNGISVPDLMVKLLNNIDINDFALNNKRESLQGPFFFENVIVNGNVTLNKSVDSNIVNLRKLTKTIIKPDNQTYIIDGQKIFKGNFKINHLKTNILNQQVIPTTNDNSLVDDNKSLNKLVIKGNLNGDIETNFINSININKLNETLLSIKNPSLQIPNIEFKRIKVRNLYVENINGVNVNNYSMRIHHLLERKHFRNLTLNGNMRINVTENVATINDHDINTFLETNNVNANVIFGGTTTIRNFVAENVNDVHLRTLTTRMLYKTSNIPQNITGHYSFNNLKTQHLYVKKMNDIDMDELIDITNRNDQKIVFPSGATFNNVVFKKSLTSSLMSPCDIYKTVSNIQYPQTDIWNNIEIHGNVTLFDENVFLYKLIHNTVKKNQDNFIKAPVLINRHALTKTVKVLDKINGVNLTRLIDDAVLNESEDEQIISACKIFSNVEAETVTVLENADILYVNNINIAELYKRTIKEKDVQNMTILGKKTFFGGLQTDKLFVSHIAGIDPERIVDLNKMKKIPSALFDNLEIINDLDVIFINNFNLDYILRNRLLTNVTGQQITNGVYYFNNIEVIDGIKAVRINDVNIDHVVFDVGKQKIKASKQFKKDISIVGNAEIEYLNGIDITKAYSDALIHTRDEIINGSLTITKPVIINGDIIAETINYYPIEKIKEIINRASNQSEESIIYEMIKKLGNIVSNNIPIIQRMPNELMYIEKSKDIQISIKETNDARVTTTKDYVLMYILGEEVNELCGLPKGCKCPVQYTVEISPHNSVTLLLNKQQQRMFSYDDDTMTVNVVTNSISTDSYCRLSSHNISDITTINWTTRTDNITPGGFYIYTAYFNGYLSGAQFFTLNKVTYTIIALYYDANSDSFDLSCNIMRFNENKTKAVIIQEIPTKGVWTIYILHTAQGIILIIGNIVTEKTTEIYRFNEELQKFILIRKIPYPSTKVVGVVLGTDSLIILANENNPLQVLKYDDNTDNYNYYQTFSFDEQVTGMSVFYVGGFGISDAYLAVVTEDSYRIYSFQYVDGWKLEISGKIKGLKNLLPVELNKQLYLFAASDKESSLLSVIKHGAGDT
ncbi:hypothetical protein GWI33_012887 [Rhynchophorus ferrugineus]|uniref:Uncharacterized protein n=1 Tax=Rhynchophorus ferrugineus TaxID=354439 RepID=A0A834M8E0_RHYFE|nr:hypothetical protein GWI33_012887 [Rhynchophorus ferrugineus]